VLIVCRSSISIACWVVVFSPQILENFRRGSADGLSLQFIIVWLLGDVFNILGAVLQGVLPTMIILAVYYTIADVVLLGQCFYYRGFTWKDEVVGVKPHKRERAKPDDDERTALLGVDPLAPAPGDLERQRRGSDWSLSHHLSPAVPLVTEPDPAAPPPPPPTRLQVAAFNTTAVLMVCAAGVAGWWLSRGYSSPSRNGTDKDDSPHDRTQDGVLHFDLWGQIFGWLCAVLYLGSRVPQLLLNWRRKSTEGVSMLFFLFACLGNLTYVLSIFAFEPRCRNEDRCKPGEATGIYWRYILVNLSWLAGSLGTLVLDLGIFVQFWIYSRNDDEEDGEEAAAREDARSIDSDSWEPRPLLQRHDSIT
jgi:solute carrier family 66 (lysosomal lysine-arginine transporter), member 1